MSIIFKVQTAIFPRNAPALVYNEDRSILKEMRLSARTHEIVEKRGGKAFFYGIYDEIRDLLDFHDEAPYQDW